ncbi:MAG: hypothetical protein OEZ36_00780 [Spirochaetota bacterium]|nr:hypothetical protein [Spirochaetota bacterium]
MGSKGLLKAIAIVALVFGILGILGGLWGLISAGGSTNMFSMAGAT